MAKGKKETPLQKKAKQDKEARNIRKAQKEQKPEVIITNTEYNPETETLGVNVTVPPKQVEVAIDTINVTFTADVLKAGVPDADGTIYSPEALAQIPEVIEKLKENGPAVLEHPVPEEYNVENLIHYDSVELCSGFTPEAPLGEADENGEDGEVGEEPVVNEVENKTKDIYKEETLKKEEPKKKIRPRLGFMSSWNGYTNY